MEFTVGSRLKHAWNAFVNNKDPTVTRYEYGLGNSVRPDHVRLTRGNERTIVTAIYNRIAADAAAITIKHVRLDENERFTEEIQDGLDYCLTQEANIDQTSNAFLLDAYLSMLDEGCVALVPVETSKNPDSTGSYDIFSIRTGKVMEWYPEHVRVKLYNERTGQQEEVTLPKKMVALVENPFYTVMNEPNSTMQRLIRKLAMLDVLDDQTASGKLDLIIQLPYSLKGELRKRQADDRRKMIEEQLIGSKYGIAYIDSTEKITQLNRSVENNLMSQIEYLTSMLYSQLGLTQAIMDGSADENMMNNYMNRIIEVIVNATVTEMRRKWLTKTARAQRQSLYYFRDPFKLVPVTSIPDIADKLTRNEIMSSNEIRQIIGLKPSDDPQADELRNKNLNQSEAELETPEEIQNGSDEDPAEME